MQVLVEDSGRGGVCSAEIRILRDNALRLYGFRSGSAP
ncbi:MAG: hypothetical protein JWL99_535 [Streptomyces oryziradicis]|nr:hypothetical protein [Actinacidiphila oryziradicis]